MTNEQEQETVHIEGTAEESLTLRRLHKHTDKTRFPSRLSRSRYGLAGIIVESETTWACDGVRLVGIPTPACLKDHAGCVLDLSDLSAGDFSLNVPVLKPQWLPPMREIQPHLNSENNPVAKVTLNARFLKDLANLTGEQPVHIIVWSNHNEPVEIVTGLDEGRKGRTPAYAVLMPMHSEQAHYQPSYQNQWEQDADTDQDLRQESAH